MTATHIQGPLQSGTQPITTQVGGTVVAGTGNVGTALLQQTITLTRDATLTQTGSVYLPKNAQIVSFVIHEDVAYDSATSATLTAGTSAAGTQFITSVNAKTGGAVVPTHTAAQTLLMKDIGTTTGSPSVQVFAQIVSVGQPTVGTVRVNILYMQR
jgi:hypothetical protein